MPMTRSTAQITNIGALILLLCGAVTASAQTYTTSPPPFLLAQNNSGAIINNACVWTYVAGTTTAATTYSDAAGTPNANPIRSDSAGRFTAFLTPGNSYKFVFESACTPPAHGTTLKTADNISAMPPSGTNVDITGTAGETISAGAVAYLSDGSGGKNAGQWYNADADFSYASTTPQVGFAVSAVTSGNSGSFRVQGRLTGLSSLSVGAAYYISATAGALSATTGVRLLGQADTTTSLVLAPNPPPATVSSMAEGRLTLTTAVPVTTADVSGATTIYYTPYVGSRIALYDGTAAWSALKFSEISISISGCTASKPYDVFVFNSSGVAALETLVWTNTTTRATALVQQDGVYVKSGATTRRYVGTFFCNSTGGQTDDSLTKRYVWNMYNRRPRTLRRLEGTATWTYTTATIRQANAAAANQVEVITGQVEDAIDLRVLGLAKNTNTGVGVYVSIGDNSTTATATGTLFSLYETQAVSLYLGMQAQLITAPTLGYHAFTWLEFSVATGTTTWGGSVGSSAQTGIFGQWFA